MLETLPGDDDFGSLYRRLERFLIKDLMTHHPHAPAVRLPAMPSPATGKLIVASMTAGQPGHICDGLRGILLSTGTAISEGRWSSRRIHRNRFRAAPKTSSSPNWSTWIFRASSRIYHSISNT